MEGTVFAVMAPADEEEIFSMYRRAAEKGRLDGSSHWNADYPDRETLREDLARGGVYGLKRRGESSVRLSGLPEPWPREALGH